MISDWVLIGPFLDLVFFPNKDGDAVEKHIYLDNAPVLMNPFSTILSEKGGEN